MTTFQDKQITRLAKGLFEIHTPYQKNSQLILDFNPFINYLIKKDFLLSNCKLIHYQAKPKYYRSWGLYDIAIDNYISTSDFDFATVDLIKSITFDERKIKTIPHAVVLLIGN